MKEKKRKIIEIAIAILTGFLAAIILLWIVDPLTLK